MKEIVKPIAVLAAICLVITALLAYINSVTAPIIADANAKAEAKAQQEVLQEADGFEEITDVALPEGVTKAVKATNGTNKRLAFFIIHALSASGRSKSPER